MKVMVQCNDCKLICLSNDELDAYIGMALHMHEHGVALARQILGYVETTITPYATITRRD